MLNPRRVLLPHQSSFQFLHRPYRTRQRNPLRVKTRDLSSRRRRRIRCIASGGDSETTPRKTASLIEANGVGEAVKTDPVVKTDRLFPHGVELDEVLQKELRENGKSFLFFSKLEFGFLKGFEALDGRV